MRAFRPPLFLRRSAFAFTATILLFTATLPASFADRTHLSKQTALDRYVARPDTNYTWRLVGTSKSEKSTTYTVEMISQSWLTTNEVSRTLWQHWLTIVKPDNITSDTGLLFIGGGNNKKEPPGKA